MSNKRIDFTQPAGFPLHQGVLDFMQSGYNDAIKGLANMAGDLVIVSGMTEAGNNVSPGWIVKGGELIPFIGGAKQNTIVVEELTTAARFLDGQDKPAFFTRQCRFGTGVGQFLYADLRRISTNSFMLDSDSFATARALKNLAELCLYESTVIISGCEVTDIDEPGQTCQISAGKVLMGSDYFVTAAYSGAYPVHINSSGQYVTAVPIGLKITFSPHTSQRKADVLRRAITPTGQIIELATWSDRFDLITGYGKWEMAGFRISDEDMGRISVGLDTRTVNPGNDIWDANYNQIGNTGGSKAKTLTMPNLPALIPLNYTAWNEGGGGHIASGGNSNEGTFTEVFQNPGGGQAFSLMNPYVIRLKAIRI
jgi:hypothetical protein